jgi:hypothetical protein
MMKIGDAAGAGQASELPESKRRVKDRNAVGAAKGVAGAKGTLESAAGFAAAFLDATQATLTRALDTIMDELGRQGEKLAGSQNFDELGKYKALVKEFMFKATQGIGKLKLTDGGSQGRSGKVHVILQKVDAGLEELTREVLAKQSTPLALLARLDQIRGLLLDLYK